MISIVTAYDSTLCKYTVVINTLVFINIMKLNMTVYNMEMKIYRNIQYMNRQL